MDATTMCLLSRLAISRPLRVQLKSGFPPKDVSGSGSEPVVALGVTTGSALTVLELKAASPPAPSSPSPPPSTATAPPAAAAPSPPPAAATPSSGSASAAPPPPPSSQADPAMVQSLAEMGFPREVAALALSAAGGDFHTALEMCMSGGELSSLSAGSGPAIGRCPSGPVTCRLRNLLKTTRDDQSRFCCLCWCEKSVVPLTGAAPRRRRRRARHSLSRHGLVPSLFAT